MERESLIDDREWVEWGFANLTLGEAIQRLRATNADRDYRGEEPLGEPPFTGKRAGSPAKKAERKLPVAPGNYSDECPLCGIHRQNAGFFKETCGDGYLKPGCFIREKKADE